jgi:hypothetical protein
VQFSNASDSKTHRSKESEPLSKRIESPNAYSNKEHQLSEYKEASIENATSLASKTHHSHHSMPTKENISKHASSQHTLVTSHSEPTHSEQPVPMLDMAHHSAHSLSNKNSSQKNSISDEQDYQSSGNLSSRDYQTSELSRSRFSEPQVPKIHIPLAPNLGPESGRKSVVDQDQCEPKTTRRSQDAESKASL